MRLIRLSCQDFRCFPSIELEPAAGLNIICGDNAQGKTSLLEALHYAATSKSHRTNNEDTIVRHGESTFRVVAQVARSDREVTVEAIWHKGVKRFKVNGVAQTRLSDILGKVNVVLFTPEDIAIVKGAAAIRRQVMDMELSQLSPPYLNALQEYRKVLRQRNELLRRAVEDESLLDDWDVQLVKYGTVLMEARRSYIEELGALAKDAYRHIADGEDLDVVYAPDVSDGKRFAAVLRDSRPGDLRRGMTARGPHRDDFDMVIADRPARTHGSQGQQKSASLAVKLAQVGVVLNATGEYPILMLDEVLAELDQKRAARLFEAIPAEVQCLVTTTDRRALTWEACGGARGYLLEGGVLRLLDA